MKKSKKAEMDAFEQDMLPVKKVAWTNVVREDEFTALEMLQRLVRIAKAEGLGRSRPDVIVEADAVIAREKSRGVR